jgi:hypothetical protein
MTSAAGFIQAIPRAYAVSCAIQGSYLGLSKDRMHGAGLISIVDAPHIEDDLEYSKWSSGHWLYIPEAAASLRAIGFTHLISLHISDVSHANNCTTGCVLMDKHHAAVIVDFIRELDDRPLVVHCAAGVSRSGAIAEFARRYRSYDLTTFAKLNPNIKPNPHILHMLLTESGLRAKDQRDYESIFE